jgi:hypothetical protein
MEETPTNTTTFDRLPCGVRFTRPDIVNPDTVYQKTGPYTYSSNRGPFEVTGVDRDEVVRRFKCKRLI